jgi:hypothetical protein
MLEKLAQAIAIETRRNPSARLFVNVVGFGYLIWLGLAGYLLYADFWLFRPILSFYEGSYRGYFVAFAMAAILGCVFLGAVGWAFWRLFLRRR